MRFDKPTGITLLWIPTAWALWIANRGFPSGYILFYMFVGTVIMRCAGCVINDIADRNIDLHVKRTKLRPLTGGEVTLKSAIFLLIGLLIIALLIVLQLPVICFYQACVALLITFIYPFCKRYIEAPQLILGLAFSMGIPMAYSASLVEINYITILLFVLNFMWIVAYDTMYAMVDRDDDQLIGVKSTAILFGAFDRLIIGVLQALLHFGWLYLAFSINVGIIYYVFWIVALFILVYQQLLIARLNRDDYLKGFLSNGWYGIVMWSGLVVAM